MAAETPPQLWVDGLRCFPTGRARRGGGARTPGSASIAPLGAEGKNNSSRALSVKRRLLPLAFHCLLPCTNFCCVPGDIKVHVNKPPNTDFQFCEIATPPGSFTSTSCHSHNVGPVLSACFAAAVLAATVPPHPSSPLTTFAVGCEVALQTSDPSFPSRSVTSYLASLLSLSSLYSLVDLNSFYHHF